MATSTPTVQWVSSCLASLAISNLNYVALACSDLLMSSQATNQEHPLDRSGVLDALLKTSPGFLISTAWNKRKKRAYRKKKIQLSGLRTKRSFLKKKHCLPDEDM